MTSWSDLHHYCSFEVASPHPSWLKLQLKWECENGKIGGQVGRSLGYLGQQSWATTIWCSCQILQSSKSTFLHFPTISQTCHAFWRKIQSFLKKQNIALKIHQFSLLKDAYYSAMVGQIEKWFLPFSPPWHLVFPNIWFLSIVSLRSPKNDEHPISATLLYIIDTSKLPAQKSALCWNSWISERFCRPLASPNLVKRRSSDLRSSAAQWPCTRWC